MDFTYFNAVYTVENALAKVTDEKGMKRVERFLKQGPCPDCGGSRLYAAARAPRLRGIGLDDACRMTLNTLYSGWRACPPACRPRCAPWPRASASPRSAPPRVGCWIWGSAT